MFNLLVQYQPWKPQSETAAVGRMFEYTEPELAERFSDEGRPAFEKLRALPCLFMQEGVEDELARVGTITRVRIAGKEILFDYALDPDIAPISNRLLFTHKQEFGIDDKFEFSRTHWSVKDVDLYQAMLRRLQPRRHKPRVFDLAEHERISPKLASVMMPFAAEFDRVYEAIKEAVADAGLTCRRGDDIWDNPAIIQDVVSLIDRSRVVICDCTGRNANVFYEIGIAHTLGREVILITQSADDIPFDLQHLRYVKYLDDAKGLEKLAVALEAKLRSLVE